MTAVAIENIIEYMINTYEGGVVDHNWGERGVFFNPDRALPKGIYILTFKEKDGPNDRASNLDRKRYYRLNLGITKDTFKARFGAIPARSGAGEVVATAHDFEKADTIMPHPVYGWTAWIGVINPSPSTFALPKPLIEEGVGMARLKYRKKFRLG